MIIGGGYEQSREAKTGAAEPARRVGAQKEGESLSVSVSEIIAKTADSAARRAAGYVRCQDSHYNAMERLLRAYPKLKYMAEHPEEYDWFPVGKSKDISVAPPPGSGVQDRVELTELHIESRKSSYRSTLQRFSDLHAVIAQFEARPEFCVIRMYYFNQTPDGQPRPEGSRRMTWDEITAELNAAGILRSQSTIRGWRSQLVQDMAVLMFGPEAALSIAAHNHERRYTDE